MRVMLALSGVRAVTAYFKNKEERVKAAVSGAVNEVAKEVFGESQRVVPVDTGNLRGSGRISPSTPETLVAELSYGGTASAYALVVHETHKSGSKYLEAPARSAAGQLKSAVERATRDTR